MQVVLYTEERLVRKKNSRAGEKGKRGLDPGPNPLFDSALDQRNAVQTQTYFFFFFFLAFFFMRLVPPSL
jgi:hypothetical protein